MRTINAKEILNKGITHTANKSILMNGPAASSMVMELKKSLRENPNQEAVELLPTDSEFDEWADTYRYFHIEPNVIYLWDNTSFVSNK